MRAGGDDGRGLELKNRFVARPETAAIQPQDRDHHVSIEFRLSGLGDRNLLIDDEPQGYLINEVVSEPRNLPHLGITLCLVAVFGDTNDALRPGPGR